MSLFIAPTEAATARTLRISYDRPITFSAVGALDPADEIAIEIPTVADPAEATDGHWQTLVIDGEEQVLCPDNLARAVPYGLLVRVKKPATSGRAIGVRVL